MSTPLNPVLLSSAVRDITPALGFPMAGYGVDTPRLATGVHRSLTARCTVFWFDGLPYAVVTADVLGFGPDQHAELRSRAERRGVSGGRYVLTATHTHSGPALCEVLDPYAAYNLEPGDALASYSAFLTAAVDGALEDALSGPRYPVALSFHVGSSAFSYNREGLSHDETQVPVLAARDADGAVRAVLFGYGAHPVAGGIHTLWDPDYPGAAIAALGDAYPGVHAQFLLGPAGDQNPRSTDGLVTSDRYGAELAAAVQEAIPVGGVPVLAAPAAVLRSVHLPFDLPELAAAERAYRARAGNERVPGFKRRHAEQMAASVERRTHIDLPLQAWLFGDLSIVFCGGEVASGFAQTARSAATAPVWFTGYANEVPGYIPTNSLLDHPCYAGARDADHPEIAGGSGTVYAYPAPLLGSPAGVEERLSAAIEDLLDGR